MDQTTRVEIVPDHEHQRAALSGAGGLAGRPVNSARHDTVAWGYARACSDMSMDIIQQCRSQACTQGGKVVGVDTTKGAMR
jgi:sarcosine oxidase subunit beta